MQAVFFSNGCASVVALEQEATVVPVVTGHISSLVQLFILSLGVSFLSQAPQLPKASSQQPLVEMQRQL